MVLSFAFCNVAVLPMRAEPSHRAEQVNQMLFGEKAEILEVNDKEWARIRCEWDQYEGWCKVAQLTQVTRREYKRAVKCVAANNNGRMVYANSEMWVPAGADIVGFRNRNEKDRFKGKKLKLNSLVADGDNVIKAAMAYLNAPYQWGGRTIAGIDCSGLTQMAFKMCNRAIPRDASQQAQEGELVDFLQNAQRGDLAFFDNADGKIIHVGLLLDNHTIIHAGDTNGHVAIDRIDLGGIASAHLKKRTHNLRFVKRLI